MKKTLFSLLTLVTLHAVGFAASALPPPATIPPELVGEWATAKSQFARDALTAGNAIYLLADGTAGFVGAPPPIGIRGIAVYDAATKTLAVTLLDDDDGGKPRQKLTLTYDPQAKTLAMASTKTAEVFKRRGDQVPARIVTDIEAAKARAAKKAP